MSAYVWVLEHQQSDIEVYSDYNLPTALYVMRWYEYVDNEDVITECNENEYYIEDWARLTRHEVQKSYSE